MPGEAENRISHQIPSIMACLGGVAEPPSKLRGSINLSWEEKCTIWWLSSLWSFSLKPWLVFLDLCLSGKADHPHYGAIFIFTILIISWHYLQEHNWSKQNWLLAFWHRLFKEQNGNHWSEQSTHLFEMIKNFCNKY